MRKTSRLSAPENRCTCRTRRADPSYRVTPESLNHIYVRTSGGETAPVGQFARLTKTYGSQSLNRFNLYGSIAVNGATAFRSCRA